jgi:hypothetical protein
MVVSSMVMSPGVSVRIRTENPSVDGGCGFSHGRSPQSARSPEIRVAPVRFARSRRLDPALLNTGRIVARRRVVSEQWSASNALASVRDRRIPASAPSYFADRYAFAGLEHPTGIDVRHIPSLVPLDQEQRQRVLRAVVVPCHALDGWRPVPGHTTQVGAFYQDLRRRWAQFATQTGLPQGLQQLSDAADMTWQDVFDESIFYPGGPAIPGATFFDTVSERDRQHLRRVFGPTSAIDFYCFMHQVHEHVHMYQTGEPLLNEIVQAHLWVAFLDANPDLWPFQINYETKVSAVRELSLVRVTPMLLPAALNARLDTARMVADVAPDGSYFVLCLLANRFDSGVIRYARYLAAVEAVLTQPATTDSLAELTSALLRRRNRVGRSDQLGNVGKVGLTPGA